MNQLNDIIKPPFTHEGGFIFDETHRLIDVPGYAGKDQVEKDDHIAHIRGWGYFQYFKNGEQLQDEFRDLLVAALNEKWERIYGEPSYWEVCKDDHLWANYEKSNYIYYKCPKCKFECVQEYNFCPKCGKQLLIPEPEVK
jgi:hypothetical protein